MEINRLTIADSIRVKTIMKIPPASISEGGTEWNLDSQKLGGSRTQLLCISPNWKSPCSHLSLFLKMEQTECSFR